MLFPHSKSLFSPHGKYFLFLLCFEILRPNLMLDTLKYLRPRPYQKRKNTIKKKKQTKQVKQKYKQK